MLGGFPFQLTVIFQVPPLPSEGLVLRPSSAAQTCGCNQEDFIHQEELITKHCTVRPAALFPPQSLAPGPFQGSYPWISPHDHVSMFLDLQGLTSYLPSLNFSYYFLITLFCKPFPPPLHILTWFGKHAHSSETEPTVTSRILSLNTWPLTPSGPLMLADHETVQICSSHSVTLPVENSALFLPQFPTQPPFICSFSLRSDFALSMRK